MVGQIWRPVRSVSNLSRKQLHLLKRPSGRSIVIYFYTNSFGSNLVPYPSFEVGCPLLSLTFYAVLGNFLLLLSSIPKGKPTIGFNVSDNIEKEMARIQEVASIRC